ncbi:hypothetical protein ACIQZO_09500 [Streptomyces sp. NPDC097617]|uniref:hypothetical protein n=1 Tax=Streptomyces sp. NPDC097617 TaxID=3366091 RepID=UPI0038272BF0
MSDPNLDMHTGTCADAASEAALDVLLAKHQIGLHTALASALDTRTGLARLARLGRTPNRKQHGPVAGNSAAPPTQRGFVVEVKSSVQPTSSTLAYAVDAVERELEDIDILVDQIEEHPNREVTPPGARMCPLIALEIVYRNLSFVADLLVNQRITKESAGSVFDVIESTLECQVEGWTQKVARAPGTQRHVDMLDLFTDRAHSTMVLRKLIVRLFEETDETVLQFN